jgi:hypothetical protein
MMPAIVDSPSSLFAAVQVTVVPSKALHFIVMNVTDPRVDQEGT